MSYTALYRKFRPQTFEDVKGQEHIVTTLKNQIKAERIGHAYLFCGTRGTGKTTVAKILAKVVNCENPIDGSPCGECALCKSIADGSSMNVVEIDAASNNGVDNIRQIREQVEYPPTEGRYRVYIIDEVHMLSVGAFNALLKTLEEPPAYVIFILATTEAHKVPITILSRCQRYDFHRISLDTIAERLLELMEYEKIQVEPKALRYVAKVGDGSMRDALSLLDQCIAFHPDELLTYEDVLKILGAVDVEQFSRLLNHILEKNVIHVITVLEEFVSEGRDMGQVSDDFTWYLRNLLLLKSAKDTEQMLDISSENLALLREDAQKVTLTELIRYVQILSNLSSQLRLATQKRVLMEVTLIKLCTPQMEMNVEALADRVEKLEYAVEKGVVVSASVSEQSSKVQEIPKKVEKPVEIAVDEDVRRVIKGWKQILAECGGLSQGYLNQAVTTLGNQGELKLVFDNENAYTYVSEDRAGCLSALKQYIAKKIGKHMNITVLKNDTGQRAKDAFPNLQAIIQTEIEEEEF